MFRLFEQQCAVQIWCFHLVPNLPSLSGKGCPSCCHLCAPFQATSHPRMHLTELLKGEKSAERGVWCVSGARTRCVPTGVSLPLGPEEPLGRRRTRDLCGSWARRWPVPTAEIQSCLRVTLTLCSRVNCV